MSTRPAPPLPRPSPLIVRWFRRYARRYLARHFHAVRLARQTLPDLGAGPTLIILNHPSWWGPAGGGAAVG